MTAKNVRAILLAEADALAEKAKSIRAWVKSADQSGFRWQEVTDSQIKTIEMILKIKLDQE